VASEKNCFLSFARAAVTVESGGYGVAVAGADVKYRITNGAISLASNLAPAELARVMTWVIDRSRLGEPPLVSEDVVRLAPDLPVLRTEARVERIYQYLERMCPTIDQSLPYSATMWDDGARPVHWSRHDTLEGLSAWTESTSHDQVTRLVEYAAHDGKVTAGMEIALTIDGWRHLDSKRAAGTESDQAFVAMWFSEAMMEAYGAAIAPATEEAGYRPLIISNKQHNNKIDDEIIAEIRRSRFVVADFTCGTTVDESGKSVAVPRGGVYFEAGFAKGLGLEVIWMVRQDQIADVHFDTRQYNHIVWTDAVDLRVKLVNRIGAVLGKGPSTH